MTKGDEIASAIYNRLGYFCLATTTPKEIGYIIMPEGSNNQFSLPLKIVSIGTSMEFEAQNIVAEGMTELLYKASDIIAKGFKYFYKVEAAD